MGQVVKKRQGVQLWSTLEELMNLFSQEARAACEDDEEAQMMAVAALTDFLDHCSPNVEITGRKPFVN